MRRWSDRVLLGYRSGLTCVICEAGRRASEVEYASTLDSNPSLRSSHDLLVPGS